MAKRVQVVLDDDTYRLLQDLAAPRAGNKSFVVREALRNFANREQVERALDAILTQRQAKEAMDEGISAYRRGRLVSHEAVIDRLRRRPRAR